jgi:hypothetical protein
MFKLAALIGISAFLFSSWFSGSLLPRLTHGPADYLLMPLLGYIIIILAAQAASRLVPEKQQ